MSEENFISYKKAIVRKKAKEKVLELISEYFKVLKSNIKTINCFKSYSKILKIEK